MKIMFIIPTLKQGGMERVVSELANYANTKGYDVSIIFLEKNSLFYHLDERINTYFPSFGYQKTFISKLIFKIKLLFYIRKIVLKVQPISVFSLPHKYNSLSVLALFKTKVPIYVSDRSNPKNNIGFFQELFRKLMYPYANGIIAQTRFAELTMIQKGIRNDNYKVIPNPVKVLKFHNTISLSPKVVLNIGRLTSGKNQKHLIEIFNEINDNTWQLIIVGSGPLQQELQSYINEIGANNVKLAGSSNDVDKWLAIAEIFAFTSISEGFPNALLEAMCYPVACISYDCDAGPRDIIKNGENGILIPIDNRQKYKEILKEMMQREDLRNSLKAESYKLREQYSLDKIGMKFLNFITKK